MKEQQYTPKYTLTIFPILLITLLKNLLLPELINLLASELFFLILAHPVYKMRIKQEPNTLELWNKLHFEVEKTDSIYRV